MGAPLWNHGDFVACTATSTPFFSSLARFSAMPPHTRNLIASSISVFEDVLPIFFSLSPPRAVQHGLL